MIDTRIWQTNRRLQRRALRHHRRANRRLSPIYGPSVASMRVLGDHAEYTNEQFDKFMARIGEWALAPRRQLLHNGRKP